MHTVTRAFFVDSAPSLALNFEGCMEEVGAIQPPGSGGNSGAVGSGVGEVEYVAAHASKPQQFSS